MKNCLFALMLLCTASVFYSCSNHDEDEINDHVSFSEITFPRRGINGVYESVVIGYSNNIEEYYFIEYIDTKYEGKYLKVSIDKDSVKTVEKGIFVYKDYWTYDIAASCQHAYIYFSPSGECKESELFHCWGAAQLDIYVNALKFIPVDRENSEEDVLPNTYKRNSDYYWVRELISDLGIGAYFAGFKLVD